jgi:Tol biopolymer transport system component
VAITHGWAPVWSPDGRRIAFYRGEDSSSRFPTQSGWSYVVDVDSAVVRPLTEGVLPVWSPDGRRIAVYRRGVIYVVDVASGRTVQLASGLYPAWSPDGTRIAFSDNRGISVINADGTDYHTVVGGVLDESKHPGILFMGMIRPVWSLDVNRQRIAFTLWDLDHGNALAAYSMDADGSNVQALSGDAPSDAPSWSPNGLRIAYVTWSSAWNGSQYVWSSPGVVVRSQCCEADMLIRVPDGNGVPISTSWSPDGSVIAFEFQNGIWIGPTGGGDGKAFITDAANIAWSPDRQRIAFVRPSER